MGAGAVKVDPNPSQLSGAGIIAAIKASGIEYVLSVPDIVTSAGLLAPIARDKESSSSVFARRTNASASPPGLSYCDKRALILIQHTGFLDSLNAIRGVAVEYKQPICMMVGLLQHDPDLAPRESNRYGVRIIEPILDDIGIAHHLVRGEADVAKIGPAIEKAYTDSAPVAILIGRSPS